MKLRELFYLLGLRPKEKTYGYEISTFDLEGIGSVQYAQWLHPSETTKSIRLSVVNELRRYLTPGDVAIDIGAHTGDTAIPMALAVGSEGAVLALEPNKYVFPVLAKNAELNADKTNILPLMIAATPDNGPIEFEYSDPGYCNGGRHEGISKWRHGHAFKLTVEGRNLVTLLKAEFASLIPKIRFVKVDTEGYDHAVLESLSPLLRETKPYVKAEVFKRTSENQRQAFIGFLESLGYAVFHVNRDDDLRGEIVKVDDVMKWKDYDIFCVPRSTQKTVGEQPIR